VHQLDGRLLQGQALHKREMVLQDCGPIRKEQEGLEDSFISITQSRDLMKGQFLFNRRNAIVMADAPAG
jgi:hypothetical protein